MADTIDIEILEDGTAKFTTDKISTANHASADEMLEILDQMLGGGSEIEQKKGHVHVHHHKHLKV